MIQRISIANRSVTFAQNKEQKKNLTSKQKTEIKPYFDSFKKHAGESIPLLLAVSGAWTAYDIISKKSNFKTALLNNVVGFFAPVLIASSAVLSIVENKKNIQK